MAYDFDGTDDYIEATSSPVSTFPVTMACWFNPDNVTTNGILIAITDGVGTERLQIVLLGTTSGDPVRAQSIDGGTVTFAQGPTGFVANQWQHAAAVFTSATSRRMYLDGVTGTLSTGNSTANGLSQINLGCTIASSTRATFLNGQMAEVGIWDAALSAAEIEALSKGIRPSLVRPSNLVFYAPLIREVDDYRGGLSLTSSDPVAIEHPRRIG